MSSDHSLRTLEYHDFLALLATYAATSDGAARLQALRPRAGQGLGTLDRELLRACMNWREAGNTLPPARFPSITEVLQRATPAEATLEIEDFLTLREFLVVTELLRDFLGGEQAAEVAAWHDLGVGLHPCADLAAALTRVFDEQGQILDRASPRLAEIRQLMDTLERRLRRRFEQFVHQNEEVEALQDTFVALRNQRYVVPVRRDARHKVRGVVHDQSNSGQTLYIEPEWAVDEGNDLATARLEERDEIRRILAALTREVHAERDTLAATALTLARYDVARAISDWASDYACTWSEPGSGVVLHRARHPLLQAQLRREGREDALVPLDLTAGPALRVLVVTGPNTGGKTVLLKTVGLLAMLVATGLPIPADPESRMEAFAVVEADIGDEQSIAQSLSTFSGHLKQVVGLLEAAEAGRALLLLDELGAGTDPAEGGALGCAVLTRLAQSDTLTLATTHLGVIKQYVQDQPGMANASMLFDQESLHPLYRLVVGRPGSSFALAIAAQLGMPEDVLETARTLLGSERVLLEHLLSEMDEQQRQLRSELEAAKEARDAASQQRETVDSEWAKLREQRRVLLAQAQQEAAAMVDRTRRQMEQVLTRANKTVSAEEIQALRREVAAKKEKVQKSQETTKPRPPKRLLPEELVVGLRVWVPALQARGKIIELKNGNARATVDVGGLRVQVDTAELGVNESGPAEPPPPPAAERASERAEARSAGGGEVTVSKPNLGRAISSELNLLGLRVEEALTTLDRFMSDATMGNLAGVRIIHGFGTGALRVAVHDFLKRYPGVKKYYLGRPAMDPGGSGVTWVEF